MTYEVPMNENIIFLHPRGFNCNNGIHFIKIKFFSLHPPCQPTLRGGWGWGGGIHEKRLTTPKLETLQLEQCKISTFRLNYGLIPSWMSQEMFCFKNLFYVVKTKFNPDERP